MDTRSWGIRLMLAWVLLGVTACQAAPSGAQPAQPATIAATAVAPVETIPAKPTEGASATSVAEDITATYSGTVSIAGMQLGIIVRFTVKDGEYQGTIDIPAQGITGIPIHDMVIESESVHFEMLSGQQLAVFNGNIAEDGSVNGTMAQGGYKGTFTIVPIYPESVDAQPAPEVAATTIITDTSGRFSAPIPTSWVASQEDGYIFLTDPEKDLKVYGLALEGDDIQTAIDAAWKMIDPTFDLPIKDSLDTPSRPGVEKTLAITYDTGDDNRIVQAVGQLKDGMVYVMVFDVQLAGAQKRASQLQIITSGFKISDLKEPDLTGVAPLTITAAITEPLEAFIEQYMEKFDIPGAAVGIVQNGKLAYAKGFGVANPDTGAPVTPETNMMIGSTGKSLTTMMMGTLVDDGLMTWDTPVIDLYPDFKVKDPELSKTITMRNLVCACTGVPRRDFEFIFNAKDLKAKDVVASLSDFEFFTKFGEAFQYSNQMVGTAGYIAGAVAEGNADDLFANYKKALQERVLDPIGMNRTTVDFDQVEAWGDYAIPYTQNLDGTYSPISLDIEKTLLPVAPAGAHWSTLEDMARYMETELAQGVAPDGTRVVSAENLHETWKPQIEITADTSYGLGWMTSTYKKLPVVTHGGNTLGFTSDFTFLPGADLGVIVLTNARASNAFNQGVTGRVLELVFEQQPQAQEQMDFYLEQMHKQADKLMTQISGPADPAAVAAYLGTFVSDALGSIELRMEDGELILDAGEFQTRMREHKDDQGKVDGYIALDAPLQTLYKFEIGDDGKPKIILGSGVIEYTFTPKD